MKPRIGHRIHAAINALRGRPVVAFTHFTSGIELADDTRHALIVGNRITGAEAGLKVPVSDQRLRLAQ